jgi:outer membrane receptor protein involved in Fe transport
LRSGVRFNLIHFNYYKREKENPDAPIKEIINKNENTQTLQFFAQGQYKVSDNLSFNLGAHYLNLAYNNSSSFEPRASVKWDINKKNSLAFGYGLHSQIQGWGVYFAETRNGNDEVIQPNKNLEFTKSHHFVLSHSYVLSQNMRLKTELYYQRLVNVPVSAADTNTTSTLNIISEFVTEALVNMGKGRNYGLEISVEKYLSNNFYYLLSSSFYQSKYTALDGVERNTRFNGNHIATLLAGKDFVSQRKPKVFGINIKTIYAGGLRTTPIDEDASREKGYTVLLKDQAFNQQNPSYFRTDLRLSLKWNKNKRTNTLSLDIQNLTNRQNVYGQWFSKQEGKVVYSYQNGLIPIINYKVEF